MKTRKFAVYKIYIKSSLFIILFYDTLVIRKKRFSGNYAKGPSACVLKEDGSRLSERILDSDGYLLAAPVWSLSPCGVATDFHDRVFGPKMDLAQWEANGIPEWENDRVKQRPGALISVGGEDI